LEKVFVIAINLVEDQRNMVVLLISVIVDRYIIASH